MSQIIIAIDPGREKCGLAVVDQQSGVLSQQIIETKALPTVVEQLRATYHITKVVLGDGTSSQVAKERLEKSRQADQPFMIELIDERHSTDQARKRYWREHPPTGLKRLIPVTMQVPPRPVDDYVAVILAERYFAKGE